MSDTRSEPPSPSDPLPDELFADVLARLHENPAGQPQPARRVAERLRELYGADVDPGVSLGDEPPSESESETGLQSKLLEHLRAVGPRGTRYRLVSEVARGGMGAIIRVWDDELRRTLAMKVLLGQDDPTAACGEPPPVDPRTLGRFLEEAQITGQLDHPGIVPLHELGLDATGRVYFTMRLVKGEDLRTVLQHVATGHDGWNQVRALNVLLRVCEAVAFAHSKGVIHRDLKPANIMVGRFGEVYVMDWGIARVLAREDRHDLRLRKSDSTAQSVVKTERHDDRHQEADSPLMTMDGDVIGTPSYMPPEQARGELEKLGPHSDVYSIGAMLYQLLTGVLPYVPEGARMSPHSILVALLHGPPPALESLAPRTPPELAAICERAMAREIEARYPTTQALAADLRAYLEGRVVAAYETGTWAETRKWVQRNKPLAASLVAAVLLGGLLVAFTSHALTQRTQMRRQKEYAAFALSESEFLAMLERLGGDESDALPPGKYRARFLPVDDSILTKSAFALSLDYAGPKKWIEVYCENTLADGSISRQVLAHTYFGAGTLTVTDQHGEQTDYGHHVPLAHVRQGLVLNVFDGIYMDEQVGKNAFAYVALLTPSEPRNKVVFQSMFELSTCPLGWQATQSPMGLMRSSHEVVIPPASLSDDSVPLLLWWRTFSKRRTLIAQFLPRTFSTEDVGTIDSRIWLRFVDQ